MCNTCTLDEVAAGKLITNLKGQNGKGPEHSPNSACNAKLGRPARDKAVAARHVPFTDQRMTKETPVPLGQPSTKRVQHLLPSGKKARPRALDLSLLGQVQPPQENPIRRL